MGVKYRADHVGSLLRPPELLEARRAGADPRRLKELEDAHILRVLRRQEGLGLKIFTDGEMRRRNFMSDFSDSVEGIDEKETVPRSWRAGESSAAVQARSVPGIVVGRIRQIRSLTRGELDFMKAHSPGDIKVTLPSANQFPAIHYKAGVTDRFYADHSALLWHIVPIIKAEVRALVDEGVRYIQLDAPRYCYYIDPKWRDYIKGEMGLDPQAALDEALRADNECLAGARGDGAILAIHLCRGNNRSQWFAEGGYDAIAEKLFGTLQADAFLLEYDSDRAGSFEPLRFVPRGKTAVLGLVSTKSPRLESVDALARRIDEAARYVPVDDLALSPQCGFASVMEGNILSAEDQWQKLALVVDTARKVWGSP